ncbi:hypothetical protein JYK14_05335 [Siccirubricoccus sp. KC 17139]|uniref:Uncharacterized protein n=1 Tax=Siccirubricoccus soli TaxID=2899147 RepID=A0ABT1D117_9PROT|nr:hypothetical protein [Siccirubricoccus soli]MCO6415601.1 hypothetical protein [Siccirubricoccus soli]MCP2681733.1 hypothetical protein [Siccirubricoccus soli]
MLRRVLLASLAALPAAAQEAPLTSLIGADMVALAAHPAVRVLLRNAARGRQQHVYEGLRLPGPPIALVGEHWLVGWGREGRRGLFLAFETKQEQLVLFLLVDGQPVYLSPRSTQWPPELAAPFADFSEGLRPE